MKILGDFFRNMFVLESYMTAIMFGSVAAGDTKSVHSFHVYFAFMGTAGILWFLTRLLYRRGYRLAIVWSKEAA